MNESTLPLLLHKFFTERLMAQMEASPNTIAGYRDTFRLFLLFAGRQTGKVPTQIQIADLDSTLVSNFIFWFAYLSLNTLSVIPLQ